MLQIDELIAADTGETPGPLELGRRTARARVVRRIASDVISFLAHVEEFQKRLWLKRKFILETSWLITLDNVPRELWSLVAANDSQHEAWVSLLAIDQVDADLDQHYSRPLSVDFLAAHQHLVLDTRHFDEDFTARLIGSIQNLDDRTSGLVVGGENFQAMTLLSRRYAGEIDLAYIDPPYNTGSDEFLYKDAYQHSSWLGMLADRFSLIELLSSRRGVFLASLDDNENGRMLTMLAERAGWQYLGPFVWRTRNTDNRVITRLSVDHEYVHVYVVRGSSLYGRAIDRTAWTNPDDDPRGPYTTDPLTGKANAQDRPNLHFTVVNHETGDVYPPDPDFGWITDKTGFERLREDNRIHWPAKPQTGKPRKKRFAGEMGERAPISSLGLAIKQGEGNQDLVSLFGFKPMNFPKPTSVMRQVIDACSEPQATVLDCFAGSGTTGHAVLDLNRAERSARKFVLIESGPHFERVLRPRLIKVAHAGSWENAAPTTRDGLSCVIKCIRLESYEDALDAVQLKRTQAQAELLATNSEVRRDYMLGYVLDQEGNHALLDDGMLARPGAYVALATVDGERRTVSIDLAETFNYLLGLRVRINRVIGGVRAIAGTDATGRSVLALWRDSNVVDNVTLEGWFEALDPELRRPDIDVIYVNGDCTLDALRRSNEGWTVRLAEDEFHHLMFEVADLERA